MRPVSHVRAAKVGGPTEDAGLARKDRVHSLQASQRETRADTVRNDRLFAVPLLLHQDRPPFELSDMPAAELKDIEDFLIAYQAADGKKAKVVGRLDRTEAVSLVRKAAQP